MNSNKGTANTHVQRINADIMRLLRSLTDANITRVETTADFSECKVWVEESDLANLEKRSGFLRTEIAHSIQMKKTPILRFMVDKGLENAARVDELLKQIRK